VRHAGAKSVLSLAERARSLLSAPPLLLRGSAFHCRVEGRSGWRTPHRVTEARHSTRILASFPVETLIRPGSIARGGEMTVVRH